MLVVLTNSKDATADYLCERLRDEGIEHVRLDSDSATRRCRVEGAVRELRISVDGVPLVPSEIHAVWHRRPEAIRVRSRGTVGERKHAAEEWTAAIESFLAMVPMRRWVNHPSANAAASHKLEQLVRAPRHGLRVPQTLVTQQPAQARRFWKLHEGRVVVKPVSDGRISGAPERLVYTNTVQKADLGHLADVRTCPTLFQQRIEKMMDVRVTVVGRRLHAIALTRAGSDDIDIRRDNMEGVRYAPVSVPRSVGRSILALVASYGLRFAALDFAVEPDGSWVFFEVNPNGQWAWLDLVGGADIASSFVREFRRG